MPLFTNLYMNVREMLKIFFSLWNYVWICYLCPLRRKWSKLCLMVSLTPSQLTKTSHHSTAVHVMFKTTTVVPISSSVTLPPSSHLHKSTLLAEGCSLCHSPSQILQNPSDSNGRNNILVVEESRSFKKQGRSDLRISKLKKAHFTDWSCNFESVQWVAI